MDFRIRGGKKLKGSVTTNTAKNSAVALLIASLLNEGETILKKVPRIEEVYRIIEVLQSIGVIIEWEDCDLKITSPKKINLKNINEESAKKTRSVVMLLGVLAHLESRFKLIYPGGCSLGSRSVNPHIFALEQFGLKINDNGKEYIVNAKKLFPAQLVLYESGDTVTENALLIASKIPGKTVIKYASSNYQVQDLCFFLEKLGVEIQGIGTTTLTVRGIKNINKNINFFPSEDPIESMLFISIAATTNSFLEIKRCPIEFLELELLKLEKMRFKFKIINNYRAYNGLTKLVDIKTYPSKLKALPEKIYARPYPGLNIDNLPFFVPIASQAQGETLIHDWVYEERAVHYLELVRLGAKMKLADPHRVFINGPVMLKNADVICPPALRPAAIILIAMLAAKGISTLKNVYSIKRGYEDLAQRLNELGAEIEIIDSD